MPFCRYPCDNCKEVFEVLQQNEEGTTSGCREFGRKDVKRLVPRAGVVYKRSGKYTTDNASQCQENRSSTGTETEE